MYVARVAIGAKMAQTAQAFLEAEAYPGPSLIIAYSHCIAHGYDMAQGMAQQKLAVSTGVWPLYRFDPRRLVKGWQLNSLWSFYGGLPYTVYAGRNYSGTFEGKDRVDRNLLRPSATASHRTRKGASYRVVILVRREPDGCDCTKYVMRSMLRKGFCLTRLREITGRT